jgi:hypothetical protein
MPRSPAKGGSGVLVERRFAVVLSAGSPADLPSWAATCARRNWALVVLSPQPVSDVWTGSCADRVVPVAAGQNRWQALGRLLQDDPPGGLPNPAYFWMPPASIQIEPARLDGFFDLVSALDMPIAQPALSQDSAEISAWTTHNAGFAARFGNAIDLRLACLSRQVVADHWARLAREPPQPAGALDYTLAEARAHLLRPCAMIDAVTVRLPPAGAAGVIPPGQRSPVCYGALGADGSVYSLFDDTADDLITRLSTGLPASIMTLPQTRQWLAMHEDIRARCASVCAPPRPPAPTAPEAAPCTGTPTQPPRGRNGRTRPTVSLVIADTDTYVLAGRAVQECLERYDFDRVLILSDDARAWNRLSVTGISPIASPGGYSDLIINRVVEHLETDYFLVAQFDGFILNAQEFSPHFFQYDYIGAPWPWYPHCSVGNGGFSWRSRRLAEAGARLGYRVDTGQAEDEFLCRTHRVRLETEGRCHFAPVELASHFSLEAGARRFPTFGFHGVFHLPALYREQPEFLIENLTPRLLRSEIQYAHIAHGVSRISAAALASLESRRTQLLAAPLAA